MYTDVNAHVFQDRSYAETLKQGTNLRQGDRLQEHAYTYPYSRRAQAPYQIVRRLQGAFKLQRVVTYQETII